MKIRMIPGKDEIGQPNGISRVIENYYKYGHLAGIEFTEGDDYELLVSHAGVTGKSCDVAILHGLYFTGDYQATKSEYHANSNIVEALRSAKTVTVPSKWVSEIIQRDTHINPFVVPHGIDYKDWEHNFDPEPYVLYNKNRDGFDVCDSRQLAKLASMAPDVKFVSTFARGNPGNIDVVGVMPPEIMKGVVQRAGVYASLTKETFGIGILEALASGVPVLGWNVGGNTDLIQHGVNGYLAEFGNYDDLLTGLFYIIKYRKVLSQNAIQTSRLWTWENAVTKLRDALVSAYEKKIQPPTVSVIIPAYNKAGTVKRAIDSVASQRYPVEKIIVVNDGSTDNTDEVLLGIKENYSNMVISNKTNGGVATARNWGYKLSDSKYICFLDADDEMDPDFIGACISALEKDATLYIAYTKLKYINPDGSSGISGWPDKWNFDLQLKRKNQVPTCCVMHRDVMERTGGFRQRYAPRGAGSEDADLWTRAGALGMKASLVSGGPLFIYHMGGSTASKNYKEVDWLGWNGYLITRQHPIASYATPVKVSHNVYQYDSPKVSIIIPVGPGHETDIIEALDSIEGQTYKQWEAIVVSDTDKELDLTPWPFVQLYRTPHPRSGPGVARNIGAQKARGGFLVFLDADDWLTVDAIEKMLVGWSAENGIVYSDYYGVATINTEELASFRNRVVEHDEKTKRTVLKHFAQDYDCELAQRQPEFGVTPYHWSIVTCLIPKAWHLAIGGFDESMKSWEDVDYHWRMAQAGYCYTRVKSHLLYYRFDSGNRRQLANPETNSETARMLLEYMHNKYKRNNNMSACKKCGGDKSSSVQPQANVRAASSDQHNDRDFIMVLYNHPNKGDHRVVGPATMTNYGYRSGGQRFLVHKSDVALMPQIFVPVQDIVSAKVDAPRVEVDDIGEPEPIVEPLVQTPKKRKSGWDIAIVPGITPEIAESLREMGFTTEKKFLGITEEQLLQVKSMSPIRVKIIMDYIKKSKEKK